MKTSSLWGQPQSRFYRFLRQIESVDGGRRSLAVIGCADGKYVLPAARRGFDVWAVDIDEVALFGGTKQDSSGEVHMPGLASRLKAEGLSERVTVTHGDFMTLRPSRSFDGVFTSGALQYSANSDHDLAGMVDAVCSLARPGGLIYFDYMLPYEEKYQGRANCPDSSWWRDHFAADEALKVLHHRVLPPVLDKAHIEYPVDHYHQWGHALLERA